MRLLEGPLDFGSLVALHGPLKAGDDCVFPDSGWGISAEAGGEGMGWPPEEPHAAVAAEGWSPPAHPAPWAGTAPECPLLQTVRAHCRVM